MGWKQNKEQQQKKSQEAYSKAYENNSAVLEAEHVAVSAFRQWVQNSDFDDRRAKTIINSPNSILYGNERNRVGRSADIAIRQTYANLSDFPDVQQAA